MTQRQVKVRHTGSPRAMEKNVSAASPTRNPKRHSRHRRSFGEILVHFIVLPGSDTHFSSGPPLVT